MIINKNQLKKALKERKENILIKRVFNMDKNNKIPEGSTATVEKVQTNAFTLKYNCLDRESWVYFENIEVKENYILYFDYIPDYRKEEAEQKAKEKGIELLKVDENDKINKNSFSNYKYIYKYVIMKNEIIER